MSSLKSTGAGAQRNRTWWRPSSARAWRSTWDTVGGSLQTNPSLLMVLARLGRYKRGPRLLDLGPFLRPNASEFPRTGDAGNWVAENGIWRKPGFREEPFSETR